jgi:hypothetical protein
MHDGLSADQHFAIQRAQRSFADTLAQLAPPGELMLLAMVAYSRSFSDMLQAGANSGGAEVLVAVSNQQLEQAGYRLVAVERN